MPYKVIGRKVYHKKLGSWSLKQTAKSHLKALRTVRLLRGLEYGWKSRSKKFQKKIFGRRRD